jgi:hypothetical protein
VGDGVDDPNAQGACTATDIGHVVERNSSVARLASMPPGHWGRRVGPGERWNVSPLVDWDED